MWVKAEYQLQHLIITGKVEPFFTQKFDWRQTTFK